MTKAEEALYEDVKDMIGDKGAPVPVDDEHFNEATYRIGMSAKRTVNGLMWSNGKGIHINDDIGEGEIKFLQDIPYSMASMVL